MDTERSLEEVITENERLRRENAHIMERITALQALQEVARSLTSELNLEPLLKNILRSAVGVMEASAGSLLLLDPATDELVFEVIEGGSGAALEKKRMPRDEGIAGWVLSNLQPVIADDVNQDARFSARFQESEGNGFRTASLTAAPLMAKGEPIGVLEILNKRSGECFTRDDLDMLVAFAATSAVAIENARLYKNLRDERDRIVSVEEGVRKRLARDLHDGPAQLLAAIIMSLRFVHELEGRAPDKAREELMELESLANKALRQVRTMLFDLRPVILETHGLVPALEQYAQHLNETGDLIVHLRIEGFDGQLTKKKEAAIFSIVQEAIGNVRKHAAAQNVWLTLSWQGDKLVVRIEDDGQGFDMAVVERTYGQRGSLGLLNMRERADLTDGILKIDSTPRQGTTVTLEVPIELSDEE